MTELEVGGVKFKGGKAFAIIMALGSMVGALYGGFEVYKDYMDMKEQIQEYEAPDLSGIEEEIAVAKETIASQNTQIDAMRTLIESQETVLGQVRETINRVDGDQQTLFTDFRAVDKRLYELERDTGQELLEVRKSIREQIEEALANPLVGQ
jgi:septal ring factor EnvC (AmiA/AmiB activator)